MILRSNVIGSLSFSMIIITSVIEAQRSFFNDVSNMPNSSLDHVQNHDATQATNNKTSRQGFTLHRYRNFNKSCLEDSIAPEGTHTNVLNSSSCENWAVITTQNNASLIFDLLANCLGSVWCLVIVLDTVTLQPFTFVSPRAVVLSL